MAPVNTVIMSSAVKNVAVSKVFYRAGQIFRTNNPTAGTSGAKAISVTSVIPDTTVGAGAAAGSHWRSSGC
jgi:hypothetical protein